jgi:hypothetical protein
MIAHPATGLEAEQEPPPPLTQIMLFPRLQPSTSHVGVVAVAALLDILEETKLGQPFGCCQIIANEMIVLNDTCERTPHWPSHCALPHRMGMAAVYLRDYPEGRAISFV